MRINQINKSTILRKKKLASPKHFKSFNKQISKSSSTKSFRKHRPKKKFNFKSFFEGKRKIMNDGFFTMRQKVNTVSRVKHRKS